MGTQAQPASWYTIVEQVYPITLGPGYITCTGLQVHVDQGDHRPAGLATLQGQWLSGPMVRVGQYVKEMVGTASLAL